MGAPPLGIRGASWEEGAARRAAAHLSRRDPVMRRAIRELGVQSPRQGEVGFRGLARAIVYQQISGAAGDAIARRLAESAGTRGLPSPRWFLARTSDELRACGLSPQKMAYLRDLSERVEDRRLDLKGLPSLGDEEVIGTLTQVHGIGRWTAEMYLIFALRRPDVLPVDDLGVQKGARHLYGFRELPARRTLLRMGERWRPFRSYATNFLWRSLQRPSWEALRPAGKSFRGPARRN